MSVRVGGIDLANTAINAELRIGLLEKIVDQLIQYAPQGAFTQEKINKLRQEVVENLKEKYPDAGIEYSNT